MRGLWTFVLVAAVGSGLGCTSIVEKLIRRHPHVFADEVADTPAEVANRWEKIKAAEKKAKGETGGVLSGIPKHLPGLLKAQRLTEKAGKVGFDWPDTGGVLKKRTFKNVMFTGGIQVSARPKDAGGNVGVYSLQGRCQWASSDTPATMMVDAAISQSVAETALAVAERLR